jgi:IK cytokine
MNQSDFRALLSANSSSGASNSETARRHNDGSRGFGGKRNLTEADLAEVKRLSKKKNTKKQSGRKPDSSSGASSASVYRDRAAERRKGAASDMVDAAEFAHLDATQSKFLGGDVAHTHLVKGLDFALLAQLKRERETLVQATSAAYKQKQSIASSGGTQPAPLHEPQPVAFKTRVGRLVYFHAVQSSGTTLGTVMTQPTEHFLPGRMYYTFNVSASTVESVPVVVQNSKEDCPEPDDVVSGMVSQLVIARVRDVLQSAHNHAGKKLRKKKMTFKDGEDGRLNAGGETDEKEFASDVATDAVPTTGVEDDESEDEDIFPDVGEYVPVDVRLAENEVAKHEKNETNEKKTSSRSDGRSQSGGGGEYFSNLSAFVSASKRKEK